MAVAGTLTWTPLDGAAASAQPGKAVQTLFKADSARESWRLGALQDYRFDVSWICYCATAGRFIVTVRDGRISEVASTETGKQIDPDQAANDLLTVDGLFDAIDGFMDARPDAVELRLDRYRGFPAHFRVDPRYGVADDELTVTIHSLTPLATR